MSFFEVQQLNYEVFCHLFKISSINMNWIDEISTSMCALQFEA